MEEPILNSHNKAEFEPAHADTFDTFCLGKFSTDVEAVFDIVSFNLGK